MSQKKVDEYKKEKANRKKIIAKQKRNAVLMKLAGFIIFSVYDKWIKEDEKATIATYALSAEEITSAFEAYTAESEENTTEPSSSENSTTDSQEETTSKNSEETTSAE